MAINRTIVLHSSLSADQCLERLRINTDEQRRTLFSLSGYQGKNPVLSRIDGDNIQLQKRRYYRNDFAPNFFGTIQPWGSSSRIAGYFGPPRWTVIFMRIWVGAAVLFTLPFTFVCLGKVLAANPEPEYYLGFLIPLVFVAFAMFLPRFGDWIGRNEKSFLLQFLETTLAAKREDLPQSNDEVVVLDGIRRL
jgi:hypothetical protein